MEKLIFEKSKPGAKAYSLPSYDIPQPENNVIPENLIRKHDAKLPETSEIEIARHFLRLSKLNYNIEEGLYPLGSCTMKYNPKINEKTSSNPGFTDLHPFSPDSINQGALSVIYHLGECLKKITNLQGVTLQPAAGAHGELTGILMFKAYHKKRGDAARTKILIPDSAHGTNPASAVIGGFEAVKIASNANGRVDIDDLASKCGDDVAGFMLTNPNTLGLFEYDIVEIEKLIHGCGGLMYMDGANLNALLGIASPGSMGFDCVHINLHKTFATPHGGGGPGAGPVCVSDKLVPFLPNPVIELQNDEYICVYGEDSIGKVHTFNGNFGMLVRALTYIRMHGDEGLKRISENAIINANYMFGQLKDKFDVPFDEHCMHEFILSGDRQKAQGANTKDMAKRLLDYGFHAPTVYFPQLVHESMLIEPTETEAKENIDDFADAMNNIADEAANNPELVTSAPQTTPVKRLNDAIAARKLNIKWENDGE